MGINEIIQIGNRIKEMRKLLGFTQKEISLRAEIPYTTYSNYENNNREPNYEQLRKITKALDIPISVLIENDELSRNYRSRLRERKDIEKNSSYSSEYKKQILDEYDSELNRIKKALKDRQQDYIDNSYDHSYSYASSEEELDRMQDAKQIELEKKRAKPFKLYETDEPPKPFTRPLQSSYDEPNESYNDSSLRLHTNTRGINWEQLDDFRFDELMRKLDRGEELTPEEINFKSAYLERCLKKVGDIFARFYSMLNVEGQKKADEQIDRAIEQIELLTKIPEYQKKPDGSPQE